MSSYSSNHNRDHNSDFYPRWDYKIVARLHQPAEEERILNDLTEQGWQIAAASDFQIHLRRPKQQAPTADWIKQLLKNSVPSHSNAK